MSIYKEVVPAESVVIPWSLDRFAGAMMWATENRCRYDRCRLRYPNDLTEAEWALIRPLIPPAKRGGRKRTVDVREIINGLMYVLSTGCQWAALPKDLPPRSTVNCYFKRWEHDRTLDRLHHALYVQCREQAGREASPTTGAIENGLVLLPAAAEWLDSYLHEMTTFPAAKHDDQVDSTSQALHWIKTRNQTPAIVLYYQQRREELTEDSPKRGHGSTSLASG